MTATARVVGVMAPQNLRLALGREVEIRGAAAMASRLGISVSSVAKILAGLRVYRGTVLLVAQALHVDVQIPGTAAEAP